MCNACSIPSTDTRIHTHFTDDTNHHTMSKGCSTPSNDVRIHTRVYTLQSQTQNDSYWTGYTWTVYIALYVESHWRSCCCHPYSTRTRSAFERLVQNYKLSVRFVQNYKMPVRLVQKLQNACTLCAKLQTVRTLCATLQTVRTLSAKLRNIQSVTSLLQTHVCVPLPC